MKILNRWTLSIIFENEKETIRETVEDANLIGANLRDAKGNLREFKTMQIETYSISFTKDILQIGCKRYSIEEWKNFDDETIGKMDSGALTFWNKWKQFIFTAIELSFGDNNE